MVSTAKPQKLYDVLKAALEGEGLSPNGAPELGGFRLGFTGEHGNFLCFARADDARALVSFFAIAPFAVEPRRREETMRLVTRINFGLPVGNFELDLDDGEVRMKTCVAFGKAKADRALIAPIVWAGVAAMDRWLPALVATGQQGLDAAKAMTIADEAAKAR